MLDVSVVIACKNGAETLAETLESLATQETGPETGHDWEGSFEILLADNGSTDASRAVFEAAARAHPGVRMRVVDAGGEKGKSFALNTGIAAAQGRALLFCDADDTVAPGWLAAMGAALALHPFVAARIDLAKLSPDWTLASRGIVQESRLNRLPHPPHALVAGGATLGFRREVFERAGGFDPAFAVMEDIDFCIRAHLAGYELVFVPEAVYHYRFRGDIAGIRRQAYSYNYYRALLRRRHGGEPLLTFRPWSQLLGRAVTLARRRVRQALRPQTSLRARAAQARAEGQIWGQVRGALAFRVAPPRPGQGRKGGGRRGGTPEAAEVPAAGGDMALTPRA